MKSRSGNQVLLVLAHAATGDARQTAPSEQNSAAAQPSCGACYQDPDLGPLLRSDPFRDLREKFPEPPAEEADGPPSRPLIAAGHGGGVHKSASRRGPVRGPLDKKFLRLACSRSSFFAQIPFLVAFAFIRLFSIFSQNSCPVNRGKHDEGGRKASEFSWPSQPVSPPGPPAGLPRKGSGVGFGAPVSPTCFCEVDSCSDC